MQNDPLRLPPLDRLAVFDAAARHLSFTKAAAERFLTQGQYVKVTEASLTYVAIDMEGKPRPIPREGLNLPGLAG